MDIYELIKNEHDKVLSIVEKLAQSTSRASKMRQEQWTKLKDNLLPHMHAEESFFYPFLMDDKKARPLALEALEEHHVARNELWEIDRTSTQDENWPVKVKVLQDLLEHHIEEEEGEVFDKARDIIGDDRDGEIAKRFKSIEQEAKAGAQR